MGSILSNHEPNKIFPLGHFSQVFYESRGGKVTNVNAIHNHSTREIHRSKSNKIHTDLHAENDKVGDERILKFTQKVEGTRALK